MPPLPRHKKWQVIALIAFACIAITGKGYGENEIVPPEKSPDKVLDVLKVLFTEKHISVNGIFTEWSARSPISFTSSSPDVEGRLPEAFVKTAWDDQKIYFTFFVRDWDLVATGKEDRPRLWNDDAVGIYLSTAPDKVLKNHYSPQEYFFV